MMKAESFNPEEFERLQGIKLGAYAIELAKNGHQPPNCIDYVKANADRWDGQHLEMGIFFLSKMGTAESMRQIACYLDHPLKHIRYTVIGLIEHRLTQPDEFVFDKLLQRLNSEIEEFEKTWIKHVCQKCFGKAQKL